MPSHGIIVDPAPDDHRHGAAGLQARAHIPQPRHRVLKELRSEPREAEIVDRLERIGLHVLFQEGDVPEAGGLGVPAGVHQETLAAVHSQHGPGRPDQACKLDCGIAKAAAGIDDRVSRAHRQRGKNLCAMQRQSTDEDMAPANELGNEDVVPEIDVLIPRGGCDFGIAHERPS